MILYSVSYPYICYLPSPTFCTFADAPPVTQPACAQLTPVQCQSPASIPLPPLPPPMDINLPSPPCPTLAQPMPQSDIPHLADTYMQMSPSFPKSKYFWEAFHCAQEAQDQAPPLLSMDAESTSKSHCCKACNSPATPITPAMCHHMPSPEVPCTCHNFKDSYDDCKDPSHLLYQYNYREAYCQHILQLSKDRATLEVLKDPVLVPWNMPALSPPLEEAIREGLVWEAALPEDTHHPSLPSDDNTALPGGYHIPGRFDLNATATFPSAIDQQLLEDCLRIY